MSLATLAGHRAPDVRAHLPAWGVPWAEVTLDVEAELAGVVELVIADLVLSCTVMSGGPSKGRSHYRVAGGKGGWGRDVAAQGYASDAGVKLSTVVQDAASAAGELMAGTLPTTRLGPSWARERGPASLVLHQVAPESWYVDETGATRIGRRAAAELAVAAERGPLDAARGTITLAAEAIATILPGVTVDGLEAVDVEHVVAPGAGLRSTLYASARVAPYRAIVSALFPWLPFARPVEYRVVTQEGERLNLQPVRVSSRMPDLRRVFVRPGVAGCRADVALGSRVIVVFVEGDPARPMVIAHEDADGAGFAPTRLDLVGEDDAVASPSEALGRIVRYGDPITFSAPGPGTVVLPGAGSLSRVRA